MIKNKKIVSKKYGRNFDSKWSYDVLGFGFRQRWKQGVYGENNSDWNTGF